MIKGALQPRQAGSQTGKITRMRPYNCIRVILAVPLVAAISIWTSTGDADHCWIVGAYFHFSVPGGWTPPAAMDITAAPTGGALGAYFGARSDPMYVVSARKRKA